MCGIIGYVGSKNPTEILIAGLKQLEYRGYDSAGVAVISSSATQIVRSVGPVASLEQKLANYILEGTAGMGHTRWATHGTVNETNCHPHRGGNTTLVHNGIIENYIELKEQIKSEGRNPCSDTDSEVLAHVIDLEVARGKKLRDALRQILPHLKGSYAFVVSHQSEPNVLVGVSNGIPLWVGIEGEEVYLSSDTRALSRFTSRGFALKRSEIVQCEPGRFQVFDFSGSQITGNIPMLSISTDESELIGFEHYMRKEIFEQPLAVLKTQDFLNQTESLSQLPLKRWTEVQLVGCGSARHAALIGKQYFEQITKVRAQADYANEFKECFEHTPKSTLVILISQSGETADTLCALREAKRRGLATLSITNRPLSTLALESDHTLFTQAGPEISVASTKAFTTQVTTILSLALEWAYQREQIPSSQRPNNNPLIHELPESIAQTLQKEKQIRLVSESLLNSSHFFFLGRGLQFSMAQECALKLKEISYCFAESYPAGELKHGPLALIDNKATVILLTSSQVEHPLNFTLSPLQSSQDLKMRNTLQEVKSRKAKVWTWGLEDSYFLKESNYFTAIPHSHRMIEPILQNVLGQLFAYHLARLKGREIDRPRNLAKSVTVE